LSHPFPTSFRRNPEDPRGLLERIEAQLRERLEEAVDLFCLDLLVKLRQAGNRSLPEKTSDEDRQEFQRLVREFLAFLREGFAARLGEDGVARLRSVEAQAAADPGQRLVAAQVFLARTLPEYWQAFDELAAGFARERLATPSPKSGLINRLFGR
jgi:hypothetical protein